MQITAIKSKKLLPPFNLLEELILSLKKANIKLGEKDILVITSKIVALEQGQISNSKNKQKLIQAEADKILYKSKYGYVTIKDGVLAVNAGIDSSNIKDGFVLYPKNLPLWTNDFYQQIKKYYKLKNLGLIITDSRSQPLRSGSMAVACAHAGFEGVEFLAGQTDIFKKELKSSRVNKADLLACSAVAVMGETNEQTPFCLIKNAPVKFTTQPKNSLKVNMRECIYGYLFKKKN